MRLIKLITPYIIPTSQTERSREIIIFMIYPSGPMRNVKK